MTRSSIRVALAFMSILAIAGVVVPVATDRHPTLGLDLQGGFSVVLQAREVDGRMPSEDSVEKAKDIIRQRVDGLGVAEPEITRQGRTVVVQLPGVTDREQAESVVGCTARLEFRPVLMTQVHPDALGDLELPEPIETPDGSDEPVDEGTGEPEAPEGEEETGAGALGATTGEGAAPAQFAPTTTIPEPEPVPETVPEETLPTETVPVPQETLPESVVDAEGGSSSSCGSGEDGRGPIDPQPDGSASFPSDDRAYMYDLGPVGFTGDALANADPVLVNVEWTVSVEARDESRSIANEAFNACYQGLPTCPALGDTSRGGGGSIAIVLDGEVVSAPQVQAANLASDSFSISGTFTESDAKDLALVLRYGSLPVEFEQAALQQVSATLGEESLQAGLIAGLIGVVALAVYMILYYRGFGVIVVLSLLVWGALMYGLVSLLSTTQGLALTLAGITGIIVSIGTTVDTYVVVFERVKDEIRGGRSVRAATELGYERGIRTVLTANAAAFLGAFLLWWLTVGPVRGFAYFLGLSVLLDLFVAVLFTRPLMLALSRSPRFAAARFFGTGATVRQDDTQVVVP